MTDDSLPCDTTSCVPQVLQTSSMFCLEEKHCNHINCCLYWLYISYDCSPPCHGYIDKEAADGVEFHTTSYKDIRAIISSE